MAQGDITLFKYSISLLLWKDWDIDNQSWRLVLLNGDVTPSADDTISQWRHYHKANPYSSTEVYPNSHTLSDFSIYQEDGGTVIRASNHTFPKSAYAPDDVEWITIVSWDEPILIGFIQASCNLQAAPLTITWNANGICRAVVTRP